MNTEPFQYTTKNLQDSVRKLVEYAQRCKPGESATYGHDNVHYWNRIVFLANVCLFILGKAITLREVGKFVIEVDKLPEFDMPAAQRKLHHSDRLQAAITGNPSPDTVLRSVSKLDENPVRKNDSVSKMRNSPCICGSGKKFKKCCMSKLQVASEYGFKAGQKQFVDAKKNALAV